MDAWGPTDAQLAIISRARAAAAADDRIVAAWLDGSFAAGTADAFSDIDLHCAVTDESAGWFSGHWSDLAKRITPLVLAGPIPGVLGGFVITPQWLHLDLVFHPRSQCDPAALTSVRPLFDRTGRCNGAIMRRDLRLVPVMLAENGVRKHDGRKRLNRYLTTGQRAFLESLPPLSSTRDSVIRFDQLVAADLTPRGRALADGPGPAGPPTSSGPRSATWNGA
jgi:hypothetical protein